MNKEIEISYEEARKLIQGTIDVYDFSELHTSSITDSVPFETVQNRAYYVTKIGHKGTKLYVGSEYETVAESGIFELKMTWDYKHPSNFAQNRNNIERTFTINI